jgi:putative ABC transport system ATP-binding protein
VSLLQADGLRFERGGRVIFEGISLSVQPGDRLAVTGPSGSGKTSLLSVLAGLAPPAAGTVRRDGVPVAAGTLPAGTAAVLQGYGLVSLLTAAENVEILLRAGGMPAREAMAAARTALARLGLGDFGDHLVQELSGGQQQRVAVARALAARPQLLIADEPTAEQDAVTRELVLAQLLGVAADGGALVLATHDPEVVARCDHVVSLAHHLTERPGARAAAPLPLLPRYPCHPVTPATPSPCYPVTPATLLPLPPRYPCHPVPLYPVSPAPSRRDVPSSRFYPAQCSIGPDRLGARKGRLVTGGTAVAGGTAAAGPRCPLRR